MRLLARSITLARGITHKILRSAPRQFLLIFGIASALNRNFRGGRIDLAEVVRREFDGDSPEVFLKAMQLGRAGDRYNPGFLGQQPGKRRRVGGLHGHLVAGKLENARQVFADKAPHQCALHVKGEVMSALVDLIPAERSFVTALRVLRRAGLVSLRVSVHDLDRHVPVARVNKQTAAVRPVHVPVRAFLVEPTSRQAPTKRSRTL